MPAMHAIHPRGVAAFAVAVLAGCAAQPTGTPPTGPAPAATASAATSAAPGAEARVEGAAAPQAGRKVPSGYRLIKRNGKELYCRSVTTLGTRFAEQMCFTRKQLDEMEERTDDTMDDFEQARKSCSGGEFCGG